VKVAAILNGLPRSYKKTYESFRSMFGNQEVDVFVYAWNEFYDPCSMRDAYARLYYAYDPEDVYVGDYSKVDPKLAERAKVLETMRPKRERKPNYSLKTGLLAQYYTIKKAYELIPDPDAYDIILRIRFDLKPLFTMEWKECRRWVQEGVCYSNQRENGLKKKGLAINDLFIVANPANFKVYVQLFDIMMKTDKYFDAIKAYNCTVPEFILAYHLKASGVKKKACPFPYELHHKRDLYLTPTGPVYIKDG